MAAKPVPQGYHTVTPYLFVDGVPKLIEFLTQAFGAQLIEGPMLGPGGKVMHAEVKIGDSVVMMGEPRGEAQSMPAMLHLYVEDVDAVYERALEAGAKSLREPIDEFYGDRTGGVKDAAGNQWWIATHKEDLSREELNRRTEAFANQQSRA